MFGIANSGMLIRFIRVKHGACTWYLPQSRDAKVWTETTIKSRDIRTYLKIKRPGLFVFHFVRFEANVDSHKRSRQGKVIVDVFLLLLFRCCYWLIQLSVATILSIYYLYGCQIRIGLPRAEREPTNERRAKALLNFGRLAGCCNLRYHKSQYFTVFAALLWTSTVIKVSYQVPIFASYIAFLFGSNCAPSKGIEQQRNVVYTNISKYDWIRKCHFLFLWLKETTTAFLSFF